MKFLLVSLWVAAHALAGGWGEAAWTYGIATAAGSAWVGDGDLGIFAVLVQTEGLAVDKSGNLYIADAADHRVRRLGPDGKIQTVAGTGTRGFSGDGGPATAAQLDSPYGLALDAAGNLYIADLGNARVRRVSTDGKIATVVAAELQAPRNLAFDSAGNLYVSDFHAHRVYRIGPDGSLTAVAGTGTAGSLGDGGPAILAQLAYPAGLAFDRAGALYIADSGNHLVRKVSKGVIRSVARAVTPAGVAFDAAGALYVADPTAGQVLKIPPSGAATAMNLPAYDLAFSATGDWYVSSGAIALRISPSGAITVAAGGGDPAHGDGGPALNARLRHPAGVAADAAGNLYIADRENHRVRRVASNGIITTIAGTGVKGDVGDGGPARYAQLNQPGSVAVDPSGNVVIADTGNHRVRVVTPDGVIRTAVSELASPVHAIPDGAGSLYIADEAAGAIFKAGGDGVPHAALAGMSSPHGLALDAQGNLYFSDSGAARVGMLAPDGRVTTIANGAWNTPRGIALDAAGRLFVADAGLQRILMVDASGQAIPVAGAGTAGFSGDGGEALAAQLSYPWDVALGPDGTVLIADLENNRIRQLTPVIAPSGQAGGRAADAVNAASLAPGPVAPGMLVLVRNTGLEAAQIPDTQILFGTMPARIVSADQAGILVLAPPQIAGSQDLQIGVLYQGLPVASIPITVTDAAPALYPAILNQDGSVNSAVNPAARGSVIELYGTGFGISGLPVSVSVGGYSAQVLYAGPVSGYPGLFQVNAQVPTGYLGSGAYAAVASLGVSFTQPGVDVWLK